MRWLAILALLAGCGDDGGAATCSYNGHTYLLGDMFPSGDGCNACSCTTVGAVCTALACADDGGMDANPASCGASGGCTTGPACGTICCHAGERCTNGACTCGGHAACANGDSCAAPGPTGSDLCGSICCGTSGPCPL